MHALKFYTDRKMVSEYIQVWDGFEIGPRKLVWRGLSSDHIEDASENIILTIIFLFVV